MEELLKKISIAKYGLPKEDGIYTFWTENDSDEVISASTEFFDLRESKRFQKKYTHWLQEVSATDAQQTIRNHDDLYKALELIESGSPKTAKKFIERFINTFEE